MNIKRFFLSSLFLIISIAPVSALPPGHWEIEENAHIQFDVHLGPQEDYRLNSFFFLSDYLECNGFSLLSSHARSVPPAPSNIMGTSSIELGQPQGSEPSSQGYYVEWTWIPPAQNPNLPPIPETVYDNGYCSVTISEGSSPPINNSGDAAGATAALSGIVDADALTYEHSAPWSFTSPVFTAIEGVTISGQITCEESGHTVAATFNPAQSFDAFAMFWWTASPATP